MNHHNGVTTDGVVQHEHPHPHRLHDVEDHVVHRDRHRRRHNYAPVAVDQKKRERGEDVEVRLAQAVGLMNEHAGVGHEADANCQSRQGGAGGRA